MQDFDKHVHFSTKRFGPISTGHRQPRASNHCKFIHGYGRIVIIKFGCSRLDERGWVVDFGSLKWVREWLEREWDHRVLIAHDDPQLRELKNMHDLGLIDLNVVPEGYGPGIEDSARYVFNSVQDKISTLTNKRCWVESVEVWEHENNSAICQRNRVITV